MAPRYDDAYQDGAADEDLRRLTRATLDDGDAAPSVTVERLVVAIERVADAAERLAELLAERPPGRQ